MPLVDIAGREFDVDVVVFDKDGTLIDFHVMWGSRAVAAVGALLDELGRDDRLERALYGTLGYDPLSGETLGNGPLATVPLPKTDVVMTTVLYQHGLPWDDAESVIRERFAPVMAGDPTAAFVKPLGDIGASLKWLNAGGVLTALATTDNRGPTLRILDMLGISHHFDVIYCGDDENRPKKPSTRVLAEIAAHYDVAVDRLMMVGDTVSDLSMARAADAGASIGVSGGATGDSVLSEWSDALIASIEEIRVNPLRR